MVGSRVLAARRRRGPWLALIAVAMVVAGCVSATPSATPATSPTGGGDLVPIVASPILAVGANRFVYSLLDGGTNEPVARPDRTATVRFRPPNDPAAATIDAGPSDFAWAIEGLRGLYSTRTTFDVPGRWTAEIDLTSRDVDWEPVTIEFDVVAVRPGITIGDDAPPVDVPVASEARADLRRVTTDANPDARLYQRSIAEALAERRPIIALFGTPGFCTTGLCAPTLEAVKAQIGSAPDVTFVQIEAYDLAFDGSRLQPVLDGSGTLRESTAFATYGLLSETTVVAIDRDGIVREILDGMAAPAEIEAAIVLIQ